jgi:hypothetical protein
MVIMQKKIWAVLTFINVTFFVTVTAIYIIAVADGKHTASGTITVNVDGTVSAVMSAGIQCSNNVTVTGAEFPSNKEVTTVTPFSIGDIVFNGDGYVDIWFEITNNGKQQLNVTVSEVGNFETGITLEKLSATCGTGGDFADRNAMLTVTDFALDPDNLENLATDGYSIPISYLAANHIYQITNIVSVAPSKTTIIVLHYAVNNVTANIPKFGIAVNLGFAVVQN